MTYGAETWGGIHEWGHNLWRAYLQAGHYCANCQSLLCLKSAVGIQAVYNELLHCVWATGLFVQLDNQAGSDIFT